MACDKLEEIAKSGDDRPFSLRVDFWGPHQPHFPTQEFLDMYPDFHIEKYGNHDDTLEGKPGTYHRERNVPLGENDLLIQPSHHAMGRMGGPYSILFCTSNYD